MSIASTGSATPPPRRRMFKVTVLDAVIIGLAIALNGYIIYRDSNELVYRWDWIRVIDFFVYYDEES